MSLVAHHHTHTSVSLHPKEGEGREGGREGERERRGREGVTVSEYSQEGGRVTQLHILLLHAQKPRTNLGIRKKDHSPQCSG